LARPPRGCSAEERKVRFEGPDYSQVLAVTGFILSAAFIVSIIIK
jgi:hypothetical protein